jgi:hypothetical protein
LVYGNKSTGAEQSVTLYARIINFQLRSVQANEGGIGGKVTIEVHGAKFTKDMQVALKNANGAIFADSLIFVDATKVFVTLNLIDASLGSYDVLAIRAKGDTAILKNGFNVVEASSMNLLTSVKHPAALKLHDIGIITVEYSNNGNVDIPIPAFTMISVDKFAIAFLKKDLTKAQTQLVLELHETNGPQNVLRPGASGSISIFVWASVRFVDIAHFRFE